ncbi:hypothetical protein GCM10028807_28460 [Spirosoma daeguense]
MLRHLVLLTATFLLLLINGVQAQIGFNSPAGVKPTRDFEVYTRNGFLVQNKFEYVNPTNNASSYVQTMDCATNPPYFYAANGILKDPGGDSNYQANQNCTQSIIVGGIGSDGGVEIKFLELDTEAYGDYINVISPYSFTHTLSGNTIPEVIYIPGNRVDIQLVSNGNSTVGAGFRLQWRAIKFNETPLAVNSSARYAFYFDAVRGNTVAGVISPNYIGGHASANFGHKNYASGYAAASFGLENNAAGSTSFAAGNNNQVDGFSSSAFALGYNNVTDGDYSFSLGEGNVVHQNNSFALGSNNVLSEPAIINYKKDNFAFGNTNVLKNRLGIAIGFNNTIEGAKSIAIGSYVGSLSSVSGSTVLGDSDPLQQGHTMAGTSNQFIARFLNGYFLLTCGNISPGPGYGSVITGVQIGRGQSSWATISDSTKKERFQAINHADLLRKIGALKLTSWNYKGQTSIRHYGPMAQDFYAAFGNDGLGQIGCDTLIYSHDMAGITLTAVQALIRENETLKSQNQELKARIERSERETADQRQRLDLIERRIMRPRTTAVAIRR